VLGLFLPTLSGRLSVFYFGPCFAAGVLSFVLSRKPRRQVSGGFWVLFLAVAICLYFIHGRYALEVHTAPVQWIFCLAVGLAIPYFADSKSELLNEVAAIIAKYSYGVYLFHCIVLWVGHSYIGEPLHGVYVAGLFCVTLFLSALAYHTIEKPVIDIGARISTRVAARLRVQGC
jgi:peptidoglycan/LPS O-acetylase OafA/YrhL